MGASFTCYYEVVQIKSQLVLFHVIDFKTPVADYGCSSFDAKTKYIVKNVKGEIEKIRERTNTAVMCSLSQMKEGASSMFILLACDEVLHFNLKLLNENKIHTLLSNPKTYLDNCINLGRDGFVYTFSDSCKVEKSFVVTLKKFNKLMQAFYLYFLFIRSKSQDSQNVPKCGSAVCKLKSLRFKFKVDQINLHKIICNLDKNEKVKFLCFEELIKSEKTKEIFNHIIQNKFTHST